MTDIWDDPELKVTDEYVKFENVGDGVSELHAGEHGSGLEDRVHSNTRGRGQCNAESVWKPGVRGG